MAHEILAATTDAGTSKGVYHDGDGSLTFTCQPVLAGSEEADLQYLGVGGWIPVSISTDGGTTAGTAQVLTATNTLLTVYGAGDYRIVKDATVTATAVGVSSKNYR